MILDYNSSRELIYIGQIEGELERFAIVHINDRGTNCHNFLLTSQGLAEYILEASRVKRVGPVAAHNGVPKEGRILDKNVEVKSLSETDFLGILKSSGLDYIINQ